MKRKLPNLRPIKSVMGSVLSKASGLCDNWQWRSLSRNLFLVKLKAFPRSGNDRARGGFCDKNLFLV